MLKLCIFIALAFVGFSKSDDGCTDQQRKDFEDYKSIFNKTYATPSAEDQARKCYCKKDNIIKEHNAGNKSYQKGHNKDSDGCNKVKSGYGTGGYVFDERKVKGGYELPDRAKKVGVASGASNINGGIDYRSLTSNVKDQG